MNYDDRVNEVQLTLENLWFNVATPKHGVKGWWVATCRDSTEDFPMDPLQHIELNLWDLGTIKEDWDAQGLVQPIRCQRVKATKPWANGVRNKERTSCCSASLWGPMDGRGEHSTQDPQVVLLISFTDLLLPNVPLSRRAGTQPRFGWLTKHHDWGFVSIQLVLPFISIRRWPLYLALPVALQESWQPELGRQHTLESHSRHYQLIRQSQTGLGCPAAHPQKGNTRREREYPLAEHLGDRERAWTVGYHR